MGVEIKVKKNEKMPRIGFVYADGTTVMWPERKADKFVVWDNDKCVYTGWSEAEAESKAEMARKGILYVEGQNTRSIPPEIVKEEAEAAPKGKKKRQRKFSAGNIDLPPKRKVMPIEEAEPLQPPSNKEETTRSEDVQDAINDEIKKGEVPW